MKKILLIISIFITYLSNSQETYIVGKTEYYYNQYYSTTGKPAVKRNEANKKTFLKSQGYDETPYGYQIDHIVPLSEGGADDPSNMQLLTISQHKSKTARERANRSNTSTTYSSMNSYSNTTSTNSYDAPVTTAKYSRTENGKIIYKGTSGGEYYVNSTGNKIYVKNISSNSSSTSNSSTYSPSSYSTPPSSPSRNIQTGPRGGQYYINSNGNKTYVKK